MSLQPIKSSAEECKSFQTASAVGRRRALPNQEIVACVLTHRDSIGLFRRSDAVTGDVARWHCITGYKPVHVGAIAHAYDEIREETGIQATSLTPLRSTVFELTGDECVWRIYAFHLASDTNRVVLNWEHDAVQWIPIHALSELPTVTWLSSVLIALGITQATRKLEAVQWPRCIEASLA